MRCDVVAVGTELLLGQIVDTNSAWMGEQLALEHPVETDLVMAIRAEVRKTLSRADLVGRFVVFDIGGNKYRLIAVIHFNRGKLYVRHVLTHAEYDEGKWKDD